MRAKEDFSRHCLVSLKTLQLTSVWVNDRKIRTISLNRWRDLRFELFFWFSWPKFRIRKAKCISGNPALYMSVKVPGVPKNVPNFDALFWSSDNHNVFRFSCFLFLQTCTIHLILYLAAFMNLLISGRKFFSKFGFAQSWNSIEFLSLDIHEHTAFKFVRFGTLLVGSVTLFFSHHFMLSIDVKVS